MLWSSCCANDRWGMCCCSACMQCCDILTGFTIVCSVQCNTSCRRAIDMSWYKLMGNWGTLGHSSLTLTVFTFCTRSTLVYKGRGKSLEGVDPPTIHRIRSTVVYQGCGECLPGADPSRIHRMRSALVYKGCGEFSKGIQITPPDLCYSSSSPKTRPGNNTPRQLPVACNQLRII